MLLGHVAIGLAAKRAAPCTSLGTLVLAAVLPDLLWCVFLIAAIERVALLPGRGAASYLRAEDIALSHSLLMDAVWGVLFAAVYLVARRRLRASSILLAAVVSHWLLDFVSHRPDMPLAPGVPKYLGLGLWNSHAATAVVEGGIWLAGIAIYMRATRSRGRTGVYALWAGIVLLTLPWWANITGPPPASVHAMAISSLIFFSGIVTWAYWLDHLRHTENRKPTETTESQLR